MGSAGTVLSFQIQITCVLTDSSLADPRNYSVQGENSVSDLQSTMLTKNTKQSGWIPAALCPAMMRCFIAG